MPICNKVLRTIVIITHLLTFVKITAIKLKFLEEMPLSILGGTMILPIVGIHQHMPSRYEDIIERLQLLGLAPTGNQSIDKTRLRNAFKEKVEKIEEEQAKINNNPNDHDQGMLMEQMLGAKTLGEQNKIFFKL